MASGPLAVTPSVLAPVPGAESPTAEASIPRSQRVDDGRYCWIAKQLANWLETRQQVTIQGGKLKNLRAFLVCGPDAKRERTLVVDEEIVGAERILLLTHVAAHLVLGHADRPLASIVEPRRHAYDRLVLLKSWEIEQGMHADALASALLLRTERAKLDEIWRLAYPAASTLERELFQTAVAELQAILPKLTKRLYASALRPIAFKLLVRLRRARHHGQSEVRYSRLEQPVANLLNRAMITAELASLGKLPELLANCQLQTDLLTVPPHRLAVVASRHGGRAASASERERPTPELGPTTSKPDPN